MLKMLQDFITPSRAAEISELRETVIKTRTEIAEKLEQEGKDAQRLAKNLLKAMADAKHS